MGEEKAGVGGKEGRKKRVGLEKVSGIEPKTNREGGKAKDH